MNIGFVVHHYDRSEGTGGYAVEILSRLARHHEVTLYAIDARAPLPPGVRLERVPALGSPAIATVLTFPRAFAAVRRAHDVVHAQGWVTSAADVVTAHIVLHAWREAARRARVRSRPGEWLLRGVVLRREAALYRTGARMVIAPSRLVREQLSRCYGRERDVAVIPHGFAPLAPGRPREALRDAFGLGRDAFVALYAGDARKGLDAALRAVAATPPVELLVVSRSPSRPYLASAEALGVAGRVRWVAGLDSLGPAFGAADVALQPTIYDAFGMIMAEAMASGVPVITSGKAGMAELLEHGRSAWLLGDDPAAEGAAALRSLMADPELRSRLAAAGRQLAQARTWDQVAEETMAVYEAACSSKAAT